MAVLADQTRRRLGTDARQSRVAVGGVADEREIVGDERRTDPELRLHARRVANLAAAAIHLHDAIADDALREVLVGRPDAHLLDALVRRRKMRGRRQRVIRLQLDHRPCRHSHRRQKLFEGVKLRPQRRIDSFAGLIAGPKLVAERLDDVVGGHSDVRRSFIQHLHDGAEHSRHRPERLIGQLAAAKTVEMAKELVRAVDEVNDHMAYDICYHTYMKRTTIFVPEALERDLQLYARRAGKPTAAIVREALAAYIAKSQPAAESAVVLGGVRQRAHRYGRAPRRDPVQAVCRRMMQARGSRRRRRAIASPATRQASVSRCRCSSTPVWCMRWPIDAMRGTRACAALSAQIIAATLLAPVTILPEVAYLLRHRIGCARRARFCPIDCQGRVRC